MVVRRRIVGPLGIWRFPILNAFLELLERWRERRIARIRRSPAPPSSEPRTTVKNVEVWEWTDYKGRKRKIVARRQVEELS